MPKESKSEKQKDPKVEKVKHNKKVTSEDLPGNGMAKKAGKAAEDYHKRRKEYLDNI